MKQKFTLFAIAALFVAVASFAQGSLQSKPLSQKHLQELTKVMGKDMKTRPALKTTQMQNNVSLQKSARTGFLTTKKLNEKNTVGTPWSKTRRAADELITEEPAGNKVLYSRSGDANYYFYGYIFPATVQDAVGNVVFGDDNTVYFKNLITQYLTNSWTKGTINGSTITIEFPQKALDNDGQYYYLNYGTIDEEFTFTPKGSLTLNYNAETGDITPASEDFINGDTQIAIVDADNIWAGYSDWNLNLKKNTDELVTAPEGLKTEIYSLTADGFSGALVNVGFSGNDVYVQGIDANLPENWIKGTISGDKVVFKAGQYIGADEVVGYHQYLMAAKGEQVYDEYYEEYYTKYVLTDGDIEFKYDAATKSLSESSTFLVNAGKTTVNYLSVFEGASITPFKEVAATPATPVITELYEGGPSYFLSGYGWGYISADIPTSDVDGKFILGDKLSYALWVRVNGEEKQITLSDWDYQKQVVETMTEVPFGYSDGWDVYASGINQTLYYYVIGPEAYGIQAIYRGAGEERRSEIAWAATTSIGAEIQPDPATPAYPAVDPSDTGSSINFGYYTGDEEIGATSNNFKPETYDVAIKIQDEALVGTHIESITFPLQEVQGVSNISAWISSQLRVENGKNVPDLASVNVVPSEAGFITVKLDKPYIIPEEGVYVGYSLTVNSVDYEANANPVAIIGETNENGFYMHTSDGFLKWMDATPIFGCNAVLQISVSGKSVKDNAAAPLDMEQQYIQSNTDFEIPLTVVNHGAKGIQSIDVNYSIAGKTGTQHIDIDPAVSGFFGKKASASVKIPAIAERGNYDLTLNIAKVNGTDNEDASNSTTVPVVVLNNVPKHRVLFEEYTGFWCGWCPRGFVSLEKLAKLYPDDYVLISYHNGDELEIMNSNSFPSPVQGFPDAYIERTMEVDPYYGSGNAAFGVANDLAAQSKVFGQASIELSASLNATGKLVNVKAEVTFPYDVENGSYALEYVLLADGLSDPSWGQSNYYAGSEDEEDLKEFCQGEETVYGLTFNDVAVLTSTIGGIQGSIPATVKADTPVTHNYNFNLAQAKNTAGTSIIQDKKNLKVAALLIDTTTGAVVNANKVKIGEATGITDLNNDSKAVQTTYYDLSGRKVLAPSNGMYIKTIRTKDGQTKSSKIAIK